MKLEYKVHIKERIYLAIMVTVSALFYWLLYSIGTTSIETPNGMVRPLTIMGAYVLFIIFFLFFRHGILIGYIKGNAILVTEKQFPDLHDIICKHSQRLGLKKQPKVFIIQGGGILNAFATRFVGSNYVVIYSDILEMAYQEGNKALGFIVGHELGHIKRHHVYFVKTLLLFPSFLVPFLGRAYSRACEYTCDNIGYALCPEGARKGIIILAVGKELHDKVNIENYIETARNQGGFWRWFAEILATHPNLPKRIMAFR